jgi:hypothetical protein
MEWGFIKECIESDKFLFRRSTRVRRKLFGEGQNSLDNESRNRIGNRRIVEDCFKQRKKQLCNKIKGFGVEWKMVSK